MLMLNTWHFASRLFNIYTEPEFLNNPNPPASCLTQANWQLAEYLYWTRYTIKQTSVIYFDLNPILKFKKRFYIIIIILNKKHHI